MRSLKAILTLVVTASALWLTPGAVLADPTTIHLNQAELQFQPEQFPDTVPLVFYYPESQIVLTGSASNRSFLGGREGVILLHSKDSMDKIEQYYNRSMEESGWRIIQSKSTGKRLLIMAESPFRKIVTVILKKANPSEIRIFYKNSGSD